MTDPDAPSTCFISTHVRHRLATVTVRDDILIRVRAGTKTLIHSGGESLCRAGDMFILARGSQWDVINDPPPGGPYEALVLQFGQKALRDFREEYGPDFTGPPVTGCATPAPDKDLEDGFERAVAALAAPDCSPRLQHHRVMEVLLLLAEGGWLLQPADRLGWDEQLRRHVAQRPQAPWTVASLAEAFHLSPSSLRRRLAEAGTSAGEVVREVRLETGLFLLQTTRLPVGEVALRCGYESHSRFSAAFRSRYGFPPSDLRTEPVAAAAQNLTVSG